jgi:hypothetical protein
MSRFPDRYKVTIVEQDGGVRTVTIGREGTWRWAQHQLFHWYRWSRFHPNIALALQLALAEHQPSLRKLGIKRKPLLHLPEWGKLSAAILKQYPAHSAPILLNFKQHLCQITLAYLAPNPPLTEVSMMITANIHLSYAQIFLKLYRPQVGPTLWLGAIAVTSNVHTRKTILGFHKRFTESRVTGWVWIWAGELVE